MIRPVSDITTIGPFNYDFLSFDVSGAGLFVTPGEQLAIAVLHASPSEPVPPVLPFAFSAA